MQDVIVAGTGPAGLIAALALARSGFRVALVGPAVTAEDRRTTALMAPAMRFLQELGLAEALKQEAAPLRAMRIIDITRRLVRSPTVTFRAAEIGELWFGLNIPNTHLLATLRSAVESSPGIAWQKQTVATWLPGPAGVEAELADGTRLAARLAVGADGRNSPARQAAGIRLSTRTYPQTALVLNFGHSRPHGDISTEFHTETGPFTQVPLPGDRSSLVWVESPDEAQRLARVDATTLSRLVEARMQSMLGRVEVEPGLQLYPLSASLPSEFARSRIALVGEAAHSFPPIGAQGLNLGIRDVRDLVGTAAAFRADPGAGPALASYDRRRRPDVLARSGAVALLNRSLLSDLLPAQLVRSAGMSLLAALPPLRGFFMREGLEFGSGLAALLPFTGRGRAAASRS